LTAAEVLVLEDVIHDHGYTTLHFAGGLEHGYVRDTVTVNANVVAATHGETAHEVLGAGDGARSHQQFVLKKPPLTYVSTAAPGGAESTLEVRVGGLLWHEAPAFYGRGRRDEVFVTRTDDDGKTTVRFGDGESGARLPSGTQNVVADYRSGIGLDGEVDAGSLTLLQARPLGIRSVTNPVPATGAADPEQLADARRNAPLTVRTLDRIVSLQDFEDFASAFAGIGKAQAVPLWSGEARVVHITVAGAQGKPVDQTSDLHANLLAAMDKARDPTQRVRLGSYQLRLFNVAAGLLVDERYERSQVEAAVESALRSAFSFDRREFGQPVTSAEVLAAIQGVPGVTAADLDKLYLVTDPAGPAQTVPATVLASRMARWNRTVIAPAQLLLLNPAGLTLTEMAP
jgi:predicted phage baseplate assembly protein